MRGTLQVEVGPHREEAQDLTQDTYVRCLDRLRARGRGFPPPWAYVRAVALNQIRDRWRRRSRTGRLTPLEDWLLAEPAVSVLLERGRFDGDDVARTASALAWLSFAIAFRALAYLNYRVLHAALKPWTQVAIGLAGIATNVVLLQLWIARWGLAVVAGAYAAANVAAAALASRPRPARLPLVSAAFAILHLSYGFGFLTGLVRFAGRWADPRPVLARLRPAGDLDVEGER